MKIYIKEANHKPIRFAIPNGLFMNRFVARIGAQSLKQQNNIHLSSHDIYKLFKALRESKKTFGKYTLVEVESSDGQTVRIEL